MQAWDEKRKDPKLVILLFFKTKHKNMICGCAELMSDYIEEQQFDYWWERVEWKGLFNVRWLIVKNIFLNQVTTLFERS